jgi:hypothetical protein
MSLFPVTGVTIQDLGDAVRAMELPLEGATERFLALFADYVAEQIDTTRLAEAALTADLPLWIDHKSLGDIMCEYDAETLNGLISALVLSGRLCPREVTNQLSDWLTLMAENSVANASICVELWTSPVGQCKIEFRRMAYPGAAS